MSQRARARVPPPPRSRRSLPSAPNKVKGLAPSGRGQGSACEPARELVGGSRGWRALGTQKRSNTRQQQPGLPPARVPGAVHAVQAGFSKLEMAHDKSCPKCHSLFGNHDAAFFFFFFQDQFQDRDQLIFSLRGTLSFSGNYSKMMAKSLINAMSYFSFSFLS